MAMIDYGAIVFKNGKLISDDMFMDMKEAVGWDDSSSDMESIGKRQNLKGNYFAYIGDSDCTIAFYKTYLTSVEKVNDTLFYFTEGFDNNYFVWKKWEKYIDEKCVVTQRNGYYVCRWKYKGDKYKVYFGYGVDIYSYKKWRIVNYYRSIPYFINKIKYKIENFIKYNISKR